MDRHSHGYYQGQNYHGSQQQQHQGNSSSFPWSDNATQHYRGQAEQNSPASIPPQNRMSNEASIYYNQAQLNYNNASSQPYTGAANQPYSNQSVYPQHTANRAPQYGQLGANNVNPWGQYNQGQSYNTTSVTPPNNTTNTGAPGQVYNHYGMYPSPQPPNQTNPNLGQNLPYTPPVHSYYQMQQQSNYYYPPTPPNQMYPTAVPPPPLPQAPPPQQVKTENTTRVKVGKNSRESSSTSSRSEDRNSTRSPPADIGVMSSNDRKSTQQTVEEKEKETKKAVPIMVGKRRGGRVLPTGVVKKPKVEGDNPKGKSDAWSQYMAEVRRYKDQSCTEERQNRPLVK